MRSPRITMGRHIIIEEAPNTLDHAALREQLATEGCGAIVSFLGITRGTEGDAEVYALEFDAWQEKLGPCLLYTSPSPRDVEESRMPSSA